MQLSILCSPTDLHTSVSCHSNIKHICKYSHEALSSITYLTIHSRYEFDYFQFYLNIWMKSVASGHVALNFSLSLFSFPRILYLWIRTFRFNQPWILTWAAWNMYLLLLLVFWEIISCYCLTHPLKHFQNCLLCLPGIFTPIVTYHHY